MDIDYIKFANEMNKAFYDKVHDSFSDTRQSSWPGWKKLASVLRANDIPHVNCVDLGCGNMRFADFLSNQESLELCSYLGVDSCKELVPKNRRGNFLAADIIGALVESADSTNHVGKDFHLKEANLVSCFGVMHHVPTPELRSAFLNWVLESMRPGALAAISFWHFMEDERIAKKATSITKSSPVSLQDGDYLLGWKETEGVHRLCHNFSKTELDALVEDISHQANCIARYRADGKGGQLNTYLVLQRL